MKAIRIASKIYQQGIGLLELILSIAVIAVLLVMATRYYQTAHMGQQVDDATGMIEAIRGASANYAAGQANYGTIDMTHLNEYGLLPKDLIGTSSTPGSAINPWGGDVTVTSNANGANAGQVAITLTNIPQSACELLSNRLSNQASSITADCGANGAGFTAIF